MTNGEKEDSARDRNFLALFERLPRRIFSPYRDYRWVWHVVAAALTAFIVLSGLDWWVYLHTRSATLLPLVMIAGAGGMLVPLASPFLLYRLARRTRSVHMFRTAAATVQAEIIAWLIVASYKACTGRLQPNLSTAHGGVDISHAFQFGFLRNGIFWGWPSHHAAVTVASMTVLFLACRNRVVRTVAILWALVVAAGAAVGFHWFSDVVAGTIIGIVTGVVVWKEVNDDRTDHKRTEDMRS